MSAVQAQPFLIVLSMWSVSLLAGSVSPGISGFWFGAIETPGSPLGVRVELRQGADGWSGTIDIPQQGAKGLLLEAVEVDGNEVGFRIQGVGGAPTFNGKLVEGRIRGTFRQGAAEFPFALERGMVPEAAEPPRPQEPTPPYPYLEREVTYWRGELEFAGTLTLPQGSEPYPAVLLLTGSGAQDRDETVFGHRPFLVLADYLTRAGIAVLRVDDRGIGGSSGSLEGVTTQDLAEDALAGVRFLQELPAIAAEHVGLLGHSEGALVATLAAAKSVDVAFIVLVAGPGVPGREILAQQNRLILEAAGVPAEVVDWQVAVLDELITLLLAGEELETLERRVDGARHGTRENTG